MSDAVILAAIAALASVANTYVSVRAEKARRHRACDSQERHHRTEEKLDEVLGAVKKNTDGQA